MDRLIHIGRAETEGNVNFGLDLPNMRECGDPRLLAELAHEAEESGWDGVFLFDSLYVEWGPGEPPPTADPWIALAAMAMRTERVRLGPMIAPLSRRRPWKVARETATLDHLSNGRFTLPVGLGTVEDGGYQNVGEELDRKKRAQMLDESLEIINGLWGGEPFSFQGEHYTMEEMAFLPKPVQSPRIPVWVVGAWPREKSMRRAIRWDGILPVVMPLGGPAPQPDMAEAGRKIAEDGAYLQMTAADIAEMRQYIERERNSDEPFDIVIEGWSAGSQRAKAAAKVDEYARAGATWWVEAIWSWLYLPPHDIEGLRRRIRQGPPRVE